MKPRAVLTKSAPTHSAADVDDRARLERLRAIAFSQGERGRRQALLLEDRERMVDEDERAGVVQVVGRAEADGAALVLRQAIHPAARRAVERHLVAVAGKEVLAEVLAELLEEVAEAPDDRVVAQHAVLLLRDVADEKEREAGDDQERSIAPP
jgi:hypothetical protein